MAEPMLRAVTIALLGICAAAANAQDAASPVDFTLRPSQDSATPVDNADSDLWSFDDTPLKPRIPAPIPALLPEAAGPRPGKPVRRLDDDDAFAPVGVQLGTFIIRPSLDVGVQATDNADGGSGKDRAVGLLVAPAVSIESNWSRHSVQVEAAGTAVQYGDRSTNVREGYARAKGRFDINRDTALDAEAGYALDLDTYTDPDTPSAAAERPANHTFTAGAGATHRFNRVSVRVGGEAARETHDAVRLAGGGTESRGDLDYTRYGLRVRTEIQAGPAFTPYVEGAGGQKHFDETVDSSGYRRSGNWGELTGGLLIDLGEKTKGEVSLGYYRESPDDRRLKDLSGLLANAALMWSPRRLTTIKLDLSTSVDPTSIAGASGSFVYSGTLSVVHQLNARLTMEAGVGIDYQRYVGADLRQTVYSGFAGASYALNRTAALQARYTHERTDGSGPGSDGDENIVTLRLRLQR